MEVPIRYRQKILAASYREDHVCYQTIMVELQANPALTGREESQDIDYRKAVKFERGRLLNFGTPILECNRLVLTRGGRSIG